MNTGEASLGELNFNELLASSNNKSSSESITSESHQLIMFKAVAESENPGHPDLYLIKATSYDHGVLRFYPYLYILFFYYYFSFDFLDIFFILL